MTDKQTRVLAAIAADHPRYLSLLRKAFEGKLSPRQAIKLRCLECNDYVLAFTRDCRNQECPLWSHRPYQGREVTEAEGYGDEDEGTARVVAGVGVDRCKQ